MGKPIKTHLTLFALHKLTAGNSKEFDAVMLTETCTGYCRYASMMYPICTRVITETRMLVQFFTTVLRPYAGRWRWFFTLIFFEQKDGTQSLFESENSWNAAAVANEAGPLMTCVRCNDVKRSKVCVVYCDCKLKLRPLPVTIHNGNGFSQTSQGLPLLPKVISLLIRIGLILRIILSKVQNGKSYTTSSALALISSNI